MVIAIMGHKVKCALCSELIGVTVLRFWQDIQEFCYSHGTLRATLSTQEYTYM